jgi:hypothetical protein
MPRTSVAKLAHDPGRHSYLRAAARGDADGCRGDQQLFRCGSGSQALERSLSLRDNHVAADRDWMGRFICIRLAIGAVSSLAGVAWC